MVGSPMPTCPNGHDISPEALFCTSCGAAVSPITPPTASVVESTGRKRSRKKLVVVTAAVAMLLLGVGAVVVDRINESRAEDRRDQQLAEHEEAFEELLSDIRAFEAVNIAYLDSYVAAEDRFFATWDPDGSFASFQRHGDDWLVASEEAANAFTDGLGSRFADFQAEVFSEDRDGDRLRAVRDAALSHYRVWKDFSWAYTNAVGDWVYDESITATWVTHADARLRDLDADIASTFQAMCDDMSKHQPASGSFKQDIASICA